MKTENNAVYVRYVTFLCGSGHITRNVRNGSTYPGPFPEGCYGYRFFDRELIWTGRELRLDGPVNCTGVRLVG